MGAYKTMLTNNAAIIADDYCKIMTNCGLVFDLYNKSNKGIKLGVLGSAISILSYSDSIRHVL